MKLEVLSGALAMVAACSGGGAQPARERTTTVPMTQVEREYVLADPHRPLGSEPVPPEFAESNQLSDEGHDAYRAKDYARSAGLFVQAALALRVPSGMYADVAAENRRLMLVNAAYAWLSAGTPELGRRELTRLRQQEWASREDVSQALELLEKR